MNPNRYYYLDDHESTVTTRIPKLRLVKDEELAILIWDLKTNVDAGSDPFENKTFDTSGLALEFSRLKNKKDKDIADFANTYGPLGVGGKENVMALDYDYHYLTNFKFQDTPSSVKKYRDLGVWFETVEEWRWHIRHVDKLLKLFDALQNSKTIEDKHLRIDKTRNFTPPTPITPDEDERFAELRRLRAAALASINTPPAKEEPYTPPECHVYWAKDKTPTLWYYEPLKRDNELSIEEEYRIYAWKVLESHIIGVLKKGSFIDYYAPRIDNKSPVGFSYTNKKATKYLLVAIYQDLYRIVNNVDEKISLCDVCKGAFKSKRKGTMYCSNACKQERKRNPKEDEAAEKEIVKQV